MYNALYLTPPEVVEKMLPRWASSTNARSSNPRRGRATLLMPPWES
ncbi:MAG: hypothetical protein ACLSAH_20745 [Bilophila wadsworthia]